MAWIYQSVVNAGLQILLSIATGWVCVACGLVSPDIIHPLNDFAFKTSIPAYILYLMGIKTDLLVAESWRWEGTVCDVCTWVPGLGQRQRQQRA
jgi:hypothetical protein